MGIKYEVDEILEGWFGEPLEHMQNEAHIRKHLYDPLRALELRLKGRPVEPSLKDCRYKVYAYQGAKPLYRCDTVSRAVTPEGFLKLYGRFWPAHDRSTLKAELMPGGVQVKHKSTGHLVAAFIRQRGP